MAKLAFSKLGLKINQEIKEIEFNGQKIEVKQYLSFQDKLKFMEDVLNNSQSEDHGTGYINWPLVRMFTDLYVLEYYTNITFTDKQKEDGYKLYDTVWSSGLVEAIYNAIPYEEKGELREGITDMIREIKHFQSSALGILNAISQDYSDLDLNAENIQKKLQNPETLNLLQQIMDKMG